MYATALACACRSSDHDAPAPSPMPRVPGDATAITPVTDAHTSDATAGGSAASPTTSDVTLTVDGAQHALRWGFAAYFEGGARIELFDAPVDCSMTMNTASELPGAHVHVFVPSGPGNHYFAGHAIGVEATVLAPTTLPIPAWAAIAKLEPSTWKQGARVRGTIEGHAAYLIGSAGVAGNFDVELCQDVDDAEDHIAATAPSGPARGKIGKDVIAPKTVLALVLHAPATRDEATDVAIDRGHGSRRFLWIGFFAEANVPCPKTGDWDPARRPALYLQNPAGAGMEHPLVGTQQPANAVFVKRGSDLLDIRAVWRGWVQFDNLGFDPNTKIRGTVWQQPPSFEDAKGTFGGRFEATVCDPFATSAAPAGTKTGP
jgi:hypothetical protein